MAAAIIGGNGFLGRRLRARLAAEDSSADVSVVARRPLGPTYAMPWRIARSRFVMVGTGRNLKSLAYADNVAAFLAFSLGLPPGVHLYNYVDKPDLTTAALVALVRRELDLPANDPLRIPYPLCLECRHPAGHGVAADRS